MRRQKVDATKELYSKIVHVSMCMKFRGMSHSHQPGEAGGGRPLASTSHQAAGGGDERRAGPGSSRVLSLVPFPGHRSIIGAELKISSFLLRVKVFGMVYVYVHGAMAPC